MTELECQVRLLRDRIGFQDLMHRCQTASAQGYLDAPTTAARRFAKMRRGLLAFLPALFLTVSSMPSGATDPQTICFAGSGKPRTDIVMCTMALLPAAELSRATLLTRRARARIQIEDDVRALEDLGQALAVNPLSAEALTEKGRVLRFLGRPTEARDVLDEGSAAVAQ